MKVVLRADAESDATEAASFYALISPALAHAFMDEVRGQLQRVADNPQLYQRVYGDVRRTLTRRFQFAIFEADSIDVLAILHTSRHPRRWQARARP